ncbi:uncharacterized protein LOC123310592 isoform X2 [Coccinella septempunctata]|nr:uncharacterized protein LOC123310592 isoform X2 [Coccinella septempunctata]
MKQKNSTPLGYAQFDFANFESSPTLTCTEELPINFDDTVPIILGNLHVTLQMGYGRLYFGNEFIACFEETQKQSSLPTTNNDRLFTSDEVLHNSNIQNKEGIGREIIAPKISQKDKIDEEVELGLNRQKQVLPITKTVLFGFIYIPEAQYTKADINSFITCRPFCQEEKCHSQLVRNETKPIFNFWQLVPLIYDEGLLQTFRDNFMVIEFWEELETENIFLGVTKLQLNQFYFAYRNADITKYLLKNKLPVISSDWWEEIINPCTNELVGQVQVLLALGTEEQIRNLQLDRGFNTHSVKANYQTPLKKNKGQHSKQFIFEKSKALINKKKIQASTTGKVNYKSTVKAITATQKFPNKSTKDQGVQFDIEMNSEKPIKEKALENEKLQQILNHLRTMRNQQHVALKDKEINTDDENKLKSSEQVSSLDSWTGQKGAQAIPEDVNFNAANSSQQYQSMSPLIRSTSDLLNTLKAALSLPPPPPVSPQSDHRKTQQIYEDTPEKKSPSSFKVHIAINQAMHLAVRKKSKVKKNKGKTMKMEDNVKPSTYVTFETMPGLDLKMSPLVQKSTNPLWNYKCDALLPSDLLTDNKQRLIFKVWRKSTNTNMIPNLQTDSIIGFAAVDLTVLLSGLPNVKGWFNIIDLSSKCNGQINIHITPLEDLAIFRTHTDFPLSCTSTIVNTHYPKNSYPTEISFLSPDCPDDHSYEDEADGELLSRALKRQFAELDEITQRLRLRLSFVTKEETEEDDDEIAEQFEKDINTLSIEEDFDMVNFEHEVSNNAPQISDLLKIECSSESSNEHTSVHNALSISTAETNVDREVEDSLSILDRQLLIGKHRIDTLLGKLSLISGDMNNSRYISGCPGSNCEESANIDTEAILEDLNRNSRPNIHASTSYDKAMFQQIYEYPNNEDGCNLSSNTSVISHLEESRPTPDGEGTLSEELKNMPM